MSATEYDVKRLRVIQSEMQTLLNEFQHIVRCADDHITYERFRTYPFAHISMALSDQHDFVGKSMFSLDYIIQSIEDAVSEEDSEEDDE